MLYVASKARTRTIAPHIALHIRPGALSRFAARIFGQLLHFRLQLLLRPPRGVDLVLSLRSLNKCGEDTLPARVVFFGGDPIWHKGSHE